MIQLLTKPAQLLIKTAFVIFGGLLGTQVMGAPAITAVEGWNMELIAQSPTIRHPSVVCSAPDGRIFVAEDPMDISVSPSSLNGRIVCIFPDGRQTVFAVSLHAVFGMQYLEGQLFVLHNPKFTVFQDDNGVGRNKVNLIESTNPNPWALDWNDHVPANFKLAMDGFFYVAIGDKGVYGAVGRDGRRVDLQGGGILRLRPDGTGLEVFSTGVRNILDVAIQSDDAIFTYDNTDEHNWMGRLTHMVDGGFYGYPHDFSPRQPYTLWMMHDFGGGAATGTFANTEDGLPEGYHNNLFLADFGKRQILRVVTEAEGATYRVQSSQEMFLDPPDDFRPVGISPSADGRSIYICDWAHRDTKEDVTVGRVWRMTFLGETNPQPKPDWFIPTASGQRCVANEDQLKEALHHASRQVRMTAQRELVRRPASNILADVINDNESPTQAKVHALWAGDAMDGGVKLRSVIRGLLKSKEALLRKQALRQLGMNSVTEELLDIIPLLKDQDASVRFEAATTLGRLRDAQSVPHLLQALQEKDPNCRFAIITALNRIGRANPTVWNAIIQDLNSENNLTAQGAQFALRETFEISLSTGLQQASTNLTWTMEGRNRAFQLLTAMGRKVPDWKGEWGAYHPALAPRPQKTQAWAGTAGIAAFCLEQLKNPIEELQLAAIEGVRVTGGSDAPRQLESAFSVGKNTHVQKAILTALVSLQDDGSDPFFAQALINAKDPIIVGEAIKGVAVVSGSKSVAALIQLIETGLPLELEKEALGVLAGRRDARAQNLFLEKARSTKLSLEIRVAAIVGLSGLPNSSSSELVRSLLEDISPVIRKAAIAAAGVLKDKAATPRILILWEQKETQEVAYDALIRIVDSRALNIYLNGLSSVNPSLREQTRKTLALIKTEILGEIERRSKDLKPEVIVELRKVYEGDEQALKGSLFSQKSTAVETSDYEKHAMDKKGDPITGQRVFWAEAGVACFKCHQLAGQGTAVGPDLTLIGIQFPRITLIEHILYPSRVVREGYQTYNFELKDGDSVSGMIKGEDGQTVTLLDNAGKVVTVSKNQISTRNKSALSLMPEGLQVGLSLDQFADLIAFLESRRSDPRKLIHASLPDGFKTLFDGKTLTGWKPSETSRDHWIANEGVLENNGNGELLWTSSDYGNFSLRMEWRLPDAKQLAQPIPNRGNSSIFVRGSTNDGVHSFSIPIDPGDDSKSRPDSPVTVKKGRDPNSLRQFVRPLGDWNSMELRMNGNRLTVIHNSIEIISNAELPKVPARGPIGLQHGMGRVQFRNLGVTQEP